MNKKGQTAFEDVLSVIPYLFFAGLLFFIVLFVVNQIRPEMSAALETNASVVNVTDQMGKISGGIGLFNSLFPLLIIGLIIMCVVSASFMGSHPVFFFVSLILLIVMVILAVVFSNVYQQITTDATFGTTDDSFNITHIFMKYLPIIAFIVVIIVVIIMFSQSGGRTGQL